MNNLVTIANAYDLDGLWLTGDEKQLPSIDWGKAFGLVQGHEPAMARLETSQRQKTEHMQQVAGLSRAGNFKEAFQVLGERVQTHGNDYLKKAADRWLSLSPDERERTAIYASGRVARTELNSLVQDGLKSEGTITGTGMALTTLQQVNTTREELRYAKTYSAGLVLDVVRRNDDVGLSLGRYEVLGSDTKGRVALRNERGREVRFNPQRIDPADQRDSLKLSEKMETKLHEGDQIRWTDNDKQRGLLNSEGAKILSVGQDVVRIENAKGEVVDLQHGDKMLERLGLSYAINMHQAQGMTTDKGIGVMHSAEQNLATQRLTYVMLTRVRDDVEIFTNDRDRLLSTISHNPGDKLSALETTGEKTPIGRIDPSRAGTFSPTIPASVLDGSSPKVNFPTHGVEGLSPGKIAEVAAPTPAKEPELPERNIERSR